MVDSRIQKLENELRARIRRFVADDSKWCSCRHEALRKISELKGKAILCGGAVRDILLSERRNRIVPRDLDIILGYAEIEKVADSFSDCTKRWNCYGGVSIQIKDWSIDMWPLDKTWAFKNNYVEGKGFSDFPKTTFLNIEAVAIQLFGRKGKKREIYSKGFFESILDRTIEINLEENPNPRMCIVRSLSVAKKYKFAIGPNLAWYIKRYANQIGLEELLELYQVRYRSIHLSANELYSFINAIEEQLRISDRRPVQLPVSDNTDYFQSELWSNSFHRPYQNLFTDK